jgi:hypothetical protein
MASMVLFRDPVSLLQAFGYSIALGGLIYYKLGNDKLKEYIGGAQRSWAEFGSTRPALRKIIVFGLVLFTMFVLLGGLAPIFAPDAYEASKSKVADLLAGGNTLKTDGGSA